MFSGAAVAAVETRLSFRVGGAIEVLAVEVGDSVEEGTLIAEIDSIDYQLRVESAQASLAQATAQLKDFESDFRRIRGLYERDNASQDDYDSSRAAVESGRAQVRAAQKQLEQARLQVSYCKLFAPAAGRVATVDAEVNENIASGQPVVTLNIASTPEVEVGIPEIVIGEINRGVRVPAITFTALPNRTATGVVSEVSPTTANGTTTYPVRVRLTSGAAGVRPGMAAEVEFRVSGPAGPARLVVPPHAVGEDRQGRFVWVISPTAEGEGAVSRRQVETGDLVEGGMEVLGGLRQGELVVTAGVSGLQEGQRVRVRPEDRI